MSEPTFTKENFDKLTKTCKKIIALSEENVDGSLTYSQLRFLGEDILEFIQNPIVSKSGVFKL